MTTGNARKTKPAGRAGFSCITNDCGTDTALRIVAAWAETIGTKRMTHDFTSDFNFSSSAAADALARRACHRLVPGCCGVTRATPDEDRRGTDYWVRTDSGRIGLDLKLRRKDYGATRGASIDCVIELDGHGTSGWLMKPTAAALILFACIDTSRVAMFETKTLQTVVMQNLSRWIANGSAKELTTESHRDGRTWTNYAVIISGDLLTSAIDRLQNGCGGAANDWEPK